MGTLAGRVCGPSGQRWVSGAKVVVRDTERETRTDPSGRFQFEDLQTGPVVLDVTKGSFATVVHATVTPNPIVTTVDPSCLSGDVQIAVFEGLYDSIEFLLADLGLQYDLVRAEDTAEWLRNPENLTAYDMLFFNCGMRLDWRLYPEIAVRLREYVKQGGSIYASDLAYLIIEDAFPEAIDFHGHDKEPTDVQRGVEGDYTAAVVDRDLQIALGDSTAHIRYDLRNWTIARRADGGDALLRASVLAAPDDPTEKPVPVDSVLAARVRVGEGSVVFTSFHNETQTSANAQPITSDMLRILEDIILSL
ncbi:MAG: carboxypeptidase-like regulatory domain-containing protein [Myxococcota bacterium]